jgi:hypothetical protein
VLGRCFGTVEQLPQLSPSRQGQFGGAIKGLEDQLQIARDDHQQGIEIMRDSTGQLADQFELLGMPKRCVHLAAIGDLVGKVPVGLGELARPFGDQLLEVAMMR